MSHLTQEKVDKMNKMPLPSRELAYQILKSGANVQGLVDPRPLWVAGKIVSGQTGTRKSPQGNAQSDQASRQVKTDLAASLNPPRRP